MAEKDYYIVAHCANIEKFAKVDTVYFRNPILEWGLVSLAISVENLTPDTGSGITGFYKELSIFNENKELVYRGEHVNSYEGPGGETVNRKFHMLEYFLFWASVTDDLKELIPPPMNPAFLPPHKLFDRKATPKRKRRRSKRT